MRGRSVRPWVVGLVVGVVALAGEVGWPVTYLVAGAGLTLLGASLADGRTRVGPSTGLWWLVIGWGVAGACVVSGDLLASKTTLSTWVAAWVIAISAAGASNRGRDGIHGGLGLTAVVLSLSVIAHRLGAPPLISNPNIVAAMTVATVPGLWRLPVDRRIRIPSVAVIALSVVVSGSRAGILALFVVVVLLWPRSRGRGWVAGLGGIAAVAAIVWRVLGRPESLAWFRWSIWGAVLRSIGDRPWFGIGAAGMAEAMGPYRLEHLAPVGHWGHVIGGAESLFLGLPARIGIPGAVAAGLALFVWCRRGRDPGGGRGPILGAMLVMGLFHDFWSEPAVVWWWAALFGLMTRREHGIGPLGGIRIHHSIPAALGAAGLLAWGLIQPTWAQTLWWVSGRSPDDVAGVVRAEPLFGTPMRARVEALLQRPAWSWDEALESLDWSERLVAVEPGSAGAWDLNGSVHSRILTEFGGWRTEVDAARAAFDRARVLEPRLPWYPLHRAVMERAVGRLEVAERLAAESVRLEPNFVRGWLLLARIRLDRGDPDGARAAMDRAAAVMQIDPSRLWSKYHRDLVWYAPQQWHSLKAALP